MEFIKILCSTTDEFHAEVEKWQKKGAAPIVRGRKLIAFGHEVAELSTSRGGYRENAGRKAGERQIPICIRLSQSSVYKLNELTNNKSEFIDKLIQGL